MHVKKTPGFFFRCNLKKRLSFIFNVLKIPMNMWLTLIPLSLGWISWIVFEFLCFIRANAVSVIVIRFLQRNERHLYTGILVVNLSLCEHISAYTLTYGVSLLQSIYRSFLRNIMSVAMFCYRRRRSEI